MGLEEQTIESLDNRCEVCGAELTPEELEDILERGGPVLCAVHADDLVELDDDLTEDDV
ncbi:unannotated protein [freshwater metagenome]|uniref:Unannotated protein n=1 Tax=freshwater metagenome TaxID=449393 RepID=A0A6J7GWW5_9ZZZZ|nr:hypothetical protein [Actinomycetota bacterium]